MSSRVGQTKPEPVFPPPGSHRVSIPPPHPRYFPTHTSPGARRVIHFDRRAALKKTQKPAFFGGRAGSAGGAAAAAVTELSLQTTGAMPDSGDLMQELNSLFSSIADVLG